MKKILTNELKLMSIDFEVSEVTNDSFSKESQNNAIFVSKNISLH